MDLPTAPSGQSTNSFIFSTKARFTITSSETGIFSVNERPSITGISIKSRNPLLTQYWSAILKSSFSDSGKAILLPDIDQKGNE